MLDAAFAENNRNIAYAMNEILERLDRLEQRMDETEQNRQFQQNLSSTPLAVDVVPTKASMKKLRASIMNLFK